MPTPIDLQQWLAAHPNVRKNIKWNSTFDTNSYHVPEKAKLPYDSWSLKEKKDLLTEYTAVWTVISGKQPLVDNIAYPPKNVSKEINVDTASAFVLTTQDYAWQMYTKWLAFHLYAEIYGLFPWKLTSFSDALLQVFLDSACMSKRAGDGTYSFGSASPDSANNVYPEDNLGTSLIAPPLYTYDFLVKNKLIGKYSGETVINVLTWISKNFTHFYGTLNYKRAEEIWQYRGLPPITAIIAGTKDKGNKDELEHWTAGCHGTGGFLINVLRAANIPVQQIIICGHAVIHFVLDGLYMDHGDDPYNLSFKASGATVNHLLINEATYIKRFGNTHNNHDGTFPGCDCSMVGHQALFPNS